MNRTAITCTSIAGLCLLGSAALLTAGPLDPPAGPVAPTYKTLSEVQPRIAISAANTPGDNDATPSLYKITQSGSYYLTQSLLVPVNRIGIEIAADGVEIDLNGFNASSLSTRPVVEVTLAFRSNIIVRNGSITGAGGAGIDLGLVDRHAVVESVRVTGCATSGIEVGPESTVRSCQAGLCGTEGILTGPHSTVIDCTANSNNGSGFFDGGIVLGTASTIINSTADANAGNGFVLSEGCRISGSSARLNGSSGIAASNFCTIADCSVYANGNHGVAVLTGCTILDSSAARNTNDGIHAESDSTIARCSSTQNHGDGISVLFNCTVQENACHRNGWQTSDGAGIHITGDENRILNNTCDGNDRGVDVTGSQNQIDGNACQDNGVSFDVAGLDNLVVRNMATGGSPNYSIAAGNSVAPRVSVADSDGWAGITNGNHPWANFGH